MKTPRYIPEYRLTINDAPIPAELRASITGVTYQTGLEGADRVELALVNQGLRWLDHPLLALDTPLRLSLGYAPGPIPQVFVGEIVSHNAGFPSSGLPTLTVAAQDRMQRLQKGTKARWFAIPMASSNVPLPEGAVANTASSNRSLPNGVVGGKASSNMPLPDHVVAGIVATEYGLVPLFDPVGAALAVLLGNVAAVGAIGDPGSREKAIRKQNGESDYKFLQRLSAEFGWEMVIDHRGPQGGYQLHFFSPLDHLAPDVTLHYGECRSGEAPLLDFSPRISNVGQIASVSIGIWVAPLKTQFSVTIGWDWDLMGLSIDIRPEFTPMKRGPSNYLIEEPVTPFTAPRRIISELIPKLNQRLTGSGSTVGDPRILAGSVLQLEGLGVQFGGLYRVTSATHTIDSSGYRTSFEVRKEIWFGSIPLPQQGAVPLRGIAPLLR